MTKPPPMPKYIRNFFETLGSSAISGQRDMNCFLFSFLLELQEWISPNEISECIEAAEREMRRITAEMAAEEQGGSHEPDLLQ